MAGEARRRRPRRELATIALALLALFAATLAIGCGYHLSGRGGASSFIPSDVQTVGIPLLENETDQPEINVRLTEALVDEFTRRGRYEILSSAQGADVLVEGAVASLRQSPVTFTEGGRFDRVEVTITARVRLVRTSPEEVLWSQNHFVFREQYDVPETPFAQFDREIVAIDDVAEGFARSVATSILEGF